MLKVQLPAQELNGGMIQLRVIGSLPSSGGDDKTSKTMDKKDAKKDDGAKKDEPVKKLYCN